MGKNGFSVRNLVLAVRFGVLWLLLALPVAGEDTLQIEFTATVPHGTFHLMQALRKAPHSSDYLRDYFQECRSLTPSQRRTLEDFEGLVAEPQLQSALEKLAVHSRNLAELGEQLTRSALFEANQAARLLDCFEAFETDYLEQVWEPSQPFLAAHLTELADTATMEEALTRARSFYGSDWPMQKRFTVALVPIPGNPKARVRTSGHSLDEVQVMEIRPGQPPLTRACIAFHELCHALWDTRTDDWSQLFADDPFAYGMLNEGLATALGNGYYDELVHRRYPEKSWYFDPVINDYAKALFPLVKSYVEPGRTLDAEFAKQAIELFDQAIPEARELTSVAAIRTMMVSTRRARIGPKTRQLVSRVARVNSMGASTDPQSGFDRLVAGEKTLLIMIFDPTEVPETGLGLQPADWKRLKASAPALEVYRHDTGWQLVLVADVEAGHRLLQQCLGRERLRAGPVTATD